MRLWNALQQQGDASTMSDSHRFSHCDVYLSGSKYILRIVRVTLLNAAFSLLILRTLLFSGIYPNGRRVRKTYSSNGVEARRCGDIRSCYIIHGAAPTLIPSAHNTLSYKPPTRCLPSRKHCSSSRPGVNTPSRRRIFRNLARERSSSRFTPQLLTPSTGKFMTPAISLKNILLFSARTRRELSLNWVKVLRISLSETKCTCTVVYGGEYPVTDELVTSFHQGWFDTKGATFQQYTTVPAEIVAKVCLSTNYTWPTVINRPLM